MPVHREVAAPVAPQQKPASQLEMEALKPLPASPKATPDLAQVKAPTREELEEERVEES